MPLLENMEEFSNVSPAILWAMFIVGALIVIMTVVAGAVSLWLCIKYIKFNRRLNSAALSGGDVARKILDKHGLENIQVSTFGSLMFGNSYSHYFKKVRLRRFTIDKQSVTSLAMGSEKAALAVLDKEGDKDMRDRVRLTPLMYFGPMAFIPIVGIGIAIDIFMFHFSGIATFIAALLGLGVYVISFVLSIKTLKTERKAQDRACTIVKEDGIATDEEVDMMKDLFKLYNIQYVNDIILEFLQLIMRVLQLIAKVQQALSSDNG